MTNGGGCGQNLVDLYREITRGLSVSDVIQPRDFTQWSVLDIANHVIGIGVNPLLIQFIPDEAACVYTKWPEVVNDTWFKDSERLYRDFQCVNVPIPQQVVLLAQSIAPAKYACTLRAKLIAFLQEKNCFEWKKLVGVADLTTVAELKGIWSRWLNSLAEILKDTIDSLPKRSSREDVDFDRWRAIARRVPNSLRTFQEVLQHEGELWSCLQDNGVGLSWDFRKKILMDMIRIKDCYSSKAIQLIQGMILEFDAAIDYPEFCSICCRIDQTLSLIGVELREKPDVKSMADCKSKGESSRPKGSGTSKNDSNHQANKKGKSCHGCGGFDHLFNGCPKAKCYSCEKMGHISTICPEKNGGNNKTDDFKRNISPPSTTEKKNDTQLKTMSETNDSKMSVGPVTRSKFALAKANEKTNMCTMVSENDINRDMEKLTKPFPKVSIVVSPYEGPKQIQLRGYVDSCSESNFVVESKLDVIQFNETGRSYPVKTIFGTEKICRCVQIDCEIKAITGGSVISCGAFDFVVWPGQEKNLPGNAEFLLGCDFTDIIPLLKSSSVCLYTIPGEDDVEVVYESGGYDLENIEATTKMLSSDGSNGDAMLNFIKSNVSIPIVHLEMTPAREFPHIRIHPYTMSPVRKIAAETLVRALLDVNYIEEVPLGSLPWVSSGFVLPKSKPGSYRLVVDFQPVNKRIGKDQLLGVNSHDIMQWRRSLRSTDQFYACVDVRDAFYNIDIDDDSRRFFGMVLDLPTGKQEFKWTKMPQGWAWSPAYWISYVNSILAAIQRARETFITDVRIINCGTAAVVAYADDLLICGQSLPEVSALFELVIDVCGVLGLYLPEEKRQYPSSSVEIMGLILSDGKMSPNEIIQTKLKNLCAPTNKDELRKVLGLLVYVSSFLSESQVRELDILHELVSTKKKFIWDVQQQAAWKGLMDNLQLLQLHFYSLTDDIDNFQTLVIQTDASEYGGGAAIYVSSEILMVNGGMLNVAELLNKRCLKLIDCYHHKFTHVERNYSSNDREGLVLYLALKRYRSLLYNFGRPKQVIIQSDNITSVYRFREPDKATVSTSGTRLRRYLRWCMELSDVLNSEVFDIRFTHIPGVENKLCDWISRWVSFDSGKIDVGCQTSDGHENDTVCALTEVSNVIEIENDERDFHRALADWQGDTKSVYLKGFLLKDIYSFKISGVGGNKRLEKIARRFDVESEGNHRKLIYKSRGRRVVVIPDVEFKLSSGVKINLRIYLVKLAHETMGIHRGIIQTLEYVRKRFWFPRLDLLVNSWVGSCEVCVISNKTVGGQYCGRVVSYPNECVCLDYCQWGEHIILVIIDVFSCYCMAFPVGGKTAAHTAHGLLSWCSLLGFPETIAADNDTSFKNSLVKELAKTYNIRELDVPVYTPTSQGVVERMVGALKASLDFLNDESIMFETRLALAVFAHNSYRRGTGGLSPINVLFGIPVRDPLSQILGENCEVVSATSCEEYSAKISEHLGALRNYWSAVVSEQRDKSIDNKQFTFESELKVGDNVMRIIKIDGRRVFRGKGIVVQKIGNSFEIRLPNGDVELAPGYQLILYKKNDEHDAIRAMTSDADVVIEKFPVGMEVSAEWTTDLGRKRFIGVIDEIENSGSSQKYWVKYYSVDQDGKWNRKSISDRSCTNKVFKLTKGEKKLIIN